MPKVNYEFDLYEDKDELKLFQKATDMYIALTDIDEMCRSKMKHEMIPDEMYEFLEKIREECFLNL